MFKSKLKTLAILLLTTAVFFGYVTGVSANMNETGWNVRIAGEDTKESLKSTKEITFEVKDNPNVVKGKIAPGMTAVATVDIDITGTEYPVDFSVSIDKKSLKYENFELVAKIDDEEILEGEVKVFEPENSKEFTKQDGKKVLTLELTWKDGTSDNQIGLIGETIELPINIKIEQHI